MIDTDAAVKPSEDEEGKINETNDPENAEDDANEEAELAKLIKEEDINMVPENTDVSEIDKLTGMPKSNGK